MTPVKRQGPSTLPNNTNSNNMTPESIQAMIDQALLRNSTNGYGSHSSHGDNQRNVQTARPCFYADFMKWCYISFQTLLKNFDREDLEALWNLVKERFSTSKPKNFSDDFLLTTLGAMFKKPDALAQVWKNQRTIHGQAKVKSWKLLESCGVHIITFTTMQLILLVERRYPLSRFTLDQMLNAVRLQVEEESEVSLELDSAKVKTVNEDVQIRALVHGKKIIVNEASIRRDLKLEDAEGKGFSGVVTPLFQTMMVHAPEEQRLRRKQRKEYEVPSPSSEIPTEEGVPATSNDLVPSSEDRLQLNELMNLFTNLHKQVLDLEKAKTTQADKIASLKKRVKKLERKKKLRTLGLKRLRKGRMNEEEMFGVNDLDGDEVIIYTTSSEKVEQRATVAEKEVSTVDPVTTVGEVVTTATSVEVSTAATTPQISMDEITLAKSLLDINTSKPNAKGIAKDKGKAKMIEPKKPLKRKDHIMVDEEVVRNLKAQMQAELEEEERLTRQKEEDANIALIKSWDNT
uniref:Synaptobrevin, longin-like domain protein n=1 Tax=Tanacetum cinerariifolium TaxID=118510 RepID=A0A699GY34_TANCI|nr:hypothetical protein [Tanacetum cinerariifolium]